MNQKWTCERKVWTCKVCSCEHTVSPHEIEGAYDSCPNCAEITEHEWVTVKPPEPCFAVVVEEADGEQWVYSKHTDVTLAQEDADAAQAKLVGAKVRVCDWT